MAFRLRLSRVASHVVTSCPVAFGPPDGPATADELALLKDVLMYNSPQITNVVATYPAQKTNLGLYNPWLTNWYCDNTLDCHYPEMGRTCGYAVTCIWGPPRDGYNRVSWINVLKALEVNRANGRPSALIIKQDFPAEYANKVGLVGGNMGAWGRKQPRNFPSEFSFDLRLLLPPLLLLHLDAANAMKVLGVCGCISDGPIRDLDELRELGMHMFSQGTSAGHGEMGVCECPLLCRFATYLILHRFVHADAVNVPVSVCGMDVAPGELVHMDENGVCKFPADKLKLVVDNCKQLQAEEDDTLANVKQATNFKELMNAMAGRTPYDDGPDADKK